MDSESCGQTETVCKVDFIGRIAYNKCENDISRMAGREESMKNKVKIRIELDPACGEPEVTIRADQNTELVERLVSVIERCVGGRRGIRTPDLLLVRQTL